MDQRLEELLKFASHLRNVNFASENQSGWILVLDCNEMCASNVNVNQSFAHVLLQ
jgi:hypothetical protein